MRGKYAISLLVLMTVGFVAQTGYIRFPLAHAVTWSSGYSITPAGSSIEEKPYVMEDSHSNLWVAYESNRLGNWTIWTQKWNGISWSVEQQLTSSTSNGLTPALVQLNNGNVMLVYTSDASGNFSLYYKIYSSSLWSNPTKLTVPQGRDSTPSLASLRNGTVVMYWTRESLQSGSVVRYIHYMSYTSGTWSKDLKFSVGGSELEPSTFQTDDGNIWLVYSANRFGNLNVFYRIYSGGLWSSELRLTSTTSDDNQSWLTQDLNGTLWDFWTRCVPAPGGTCEDDVFYSTSTNLGVTWNGQVQFTVDPSGFTIQDSHPAAIHYERDKMMYVFWGTDLTGPGTKYGVWVRTSNPLLIHDVSVSNASAGPISLQEGGSVKVNGTVNNPGNYNETVSVNGYYQNLTAVLFKSVTLSLRAGSSSFIHWSWNTSKVVPAKYKIILLAVPVPGESIRLTAGNTAVGGNATVLAFPADIDQNGRVDIVDVATVAFGFGTSIIGDTDGDCSIQMPDVSFVAFYFGTNSSSPNWNPLADLNHDGKVNMLDVSLIAFEFGMKIGPGDFDNDCAININDVAFVAYWFGWGT